MFVICLCMLEGNVLFNDVLNTFYFRLYGILVMKHMFVILSRNICLLFCHEKCLLFVCVCCMLEGNLLFNDALNTFYFRLYGILVMKHMFVKMS